MVRGPGQVSSSGVGRLLDLDASQYDTDKSRKYLENYERWLGHLTDEPIAILELGVQRGGSLEMWRDAFPNATVVGLDLNPSTTNDTTGRIRLYQGFQQDVATLDRVGATEAPGGFDVIIDDASHLGSYTSESFWHLFPNHLKPGGLYVLEDWSCAYWDSWSDGRRFEAEPDVGEVRRTRRSEAQQRLRLVARPVARRLQEVPALRKRLEGAFLRVERSLVQTRFPSHDFGMAGIVKQLVDVTAAAAIARDPNGVAPPDLIARMEITASQVLIVKKPAMAA
jgi:hypothetical protein